MIFAFVYVLVMGNIRDLTIFLAFQSASFSFSLLVRVCVCVCVGGQVGPPPYTHTLQKAKKRKNSTLECKENSQILNISDHKNVNKRKNRLTPLKLCSKKHHKKVMALREGTRRPSRKSHVPSMIWQRKDGRLKTNIN